jgi:hypothetical protein
MLCEAYGLGKPNPWVDHIGGIASHVAVSHRGKLRFGVALHDVGWLPSLEGAPPVPPSLPLSGRCFMFGWVPCLEPAYILWDICCGCSFERVTLCGHARHRGRRMVRVRRNLDKIHAQGWGGGVPRGMVTGLAPIVVYSKPLRVI